MARSTLSSSTPTLFCTPDGQCSEAVELRPSRDLVSDPAGHPTVGRPEQAGLWLREHPDMDAIDGRTAHRLFMTICQFPAKRASWLREIVGGSSGEVSRHLTRFVQTGLVAVFDGRHYLSELGMRRAANMSRVLPSVIRSRHGAGAYCTANFSLGGLNIRSRAGDPGSAPTSLRPSLSPLRPCEDNAGHGGFVGVSTKARCRTDLEARMRPRRLCSSRYPPSA